VIIFLIFPKTGEWGEKRPPYIYTTIYTGAILPNFHPDKPVRPLDEQKKETQNDPI